MKQLHGLVGLSAQMPPPLNTSRTGYFVDALAGVSDQMTVAVSHSETVAGAQALWERVQDTAYLRLATDFEIALAERAYTRRVIYESQKAEPLHPPKLVQVDEPSVVFIYAPDSRYVEIKVDSFTLRSVSSSTNPPNAAGQILVKDYFSDEVLHTADFAANGTFEQIVPVNKTFFKRALKCELRAHGNAYHELNYSCGGCHFRSDWIWGSVRHIEPEKSNPVLWPDVQISCSPVAILKAHENLFAYASMNLLAHQVLNAKASAMIEGRKFNFFTTSNLAQTEELAAKYELAYAKAMGAAVKAVSLEDEVCFPCGESFSVSITESLP